MLFQTSKESGESGVGQQDACPEKRYQRTESQPTSQLFLCRYTTFLKYTRSMHPSPEKKVSHLCCHHHGKRVTVSFSFSLYFSLPLHSVSPPRFPFPFPLRYPFRFHFYNVPNFTFFPFFLAPSRRPLPFLALSYISISILLSPSPFPSSLCVSLSLSPFPSHFSSSLPHPSLPIPILCSHLPASIPIPMPCRPSIPCVSSPFPVSSAQVVFSSSRHITTTEEIHPDKGGVGGRWGREGENKRLLPSCSTTPQDMGRIPKLLHQDGSRTEILHISSNFGVVINFFEFYMFCHVHVVF